MPIDYEAMANAVLFVVTGILGYLGIRRGIKAPASADAGVEKPDSGMRIAGALIDATKADELIKAHDRGIVATANLEAALLENTTALSNNTDAVNHARVEVDQVQNDVRALTIELARGK